MNAGVSTLQLCFYFNKHQPHKRGASKYASRQFLCSFNARLFVRSSIYSQCRFTKHRLLYNVSVIGYQMKRDLRHLHEEEHARRITHLDTTGGHYSLASFTAPYSTTPSAADPHVPVRSVMPSRAICNASKLLYYSNDKCTVNSSVPGAPAQFNCSMQITGAD